MTEDEKRLMYHLGLEDPEDLTQDMLDEMVHHYKSGDAAEINNGGREEQIRYILECMGEGKKRPEFFVGQRVATVHTIDITYGQGRREVVPKGTQGVVIYESEGQWGVAWDNGLSIEALPSDLVTLPPGEIPPSTRDALRRLLHHYWEPVSYRFDRLTRDEQRIILRTDFELLLEWLRVGGD